MKSNFKPVVGHEFQFTAGCNEGLNFNGIIKCRVLEVSPFNKLSYSWECSSIENKVNIDSVVNWTLTSKDNGTMLLLEHNGFKVLDNLPLFNAMEKGWVQHIGTMANNLNESVHADTNA